MALFTHKKRIKFPKQEINPQQEINEISERLSYLTNKQIHIKKQNIKQNNASETEILHLKNQLKVIKSDIIEIKQKTQQVKNNFDNAIKELNMRAKIEDLDRVKRIIQEYDPADLIPYEDFRKIAEERINALINKPT